MMVRTEGLTKWFPTRRSFGEAARHPFARPRTLVLDQVDLSVERGEFFGLLGPNGAGKTTLFKILATLISGDGGEAWIDGVPVGPEGQRVRRMVTMVIPDERSLYWRLTALENLRLYATLYGAQGHEAKRRAGEMLEVVGLSDTGTRLAGQFSSGMKQRLLIARALLSKPRVLLLDEPTRSLDPIAARDFRHFLRTELAARQGCTVLVATHNADEAFEMCDRLAVLDRGRLLASGSAEELSRRVQDDVYEVVARGDVEALTAALPRDATVLGNGATGKGEWKHFEMRVPRGEEGAATTLSTLVRSGIPIARFERKQPMLADLIERIMAAARS